MSIIDRAKSTTLLPPLMSGEHLDQPTFHERYEAMPPGTWAELVGGVVYMPSPLRDEHGGNDDVVGGWLLWYRKATPGLRGGANVTTKLGPSGEVQLDRHLRIREELGGRSRIVSGYIV